MNNISKPKILIVDDTPANLVALNLLLKKVSAEVIRAGSGAQALQLTLEHDFALILLDAHMPEMDGYETAEILGSTPGTDTIPIIFVTAAYKDEVHRLNSYKAGAVDYIQKPIEDHILISKVTVFLELYNQRSQLKLLTENLELLVQERTEELRITNKIACIGGWKISLDHKYVVLSDQALEILSITGYFPEQEIPLNKFIERVYEDDREAVLLALSKILKNPHKEITFEFRFVDNEENLHTANIIINPMKKKSIFFVGTLQDITERKESERAVQIMAKYDALTQLPNRYLFNDRIELAFATSNRLKNKVNLIIIDLDHFKDINDTLGHPIGDLLLIEVAQRLLNCVRDTDTVARLGGDEFAIIALETQDTLAINTLAERCLKSLVKPFELDDHTVNISASIGVAVFPDDGNNQEEIIKCADIALYQSKDNGRNCYHFYNKIMDESIHLRIEEEKQLASAIAEEQLELYYQPQIDLKSKKVIGAEALVRWNHPTKGLLLPADFIPLAEQVGLIIPMGKLIFKMAAKQINAWSKARVLDIKIAVNLSVKQVHYCDFIAMVEDTILELESGVDFLELEVPELAMFEDSKNETDIFEQLKNKGISLVVDNFGTGFSSMLSLKQISAEFLKVDRQFIKNVNRDSVDDKIFQSIIELAHTLKMKVIAEGVENPSQLSFLLKNNCDIAQGFIYSHPIPADEFITWLGHYQADIV
jgi:diguanylate cyclase (GGDEF)-like protein/PAS domain S-box-containing protein